MSTSTARPADPKKRGSLFVRLVIGRALLLGVGLMVMLAVQMFGTVVGEEFSPDKFTRRTFFYCEIPIVRVQVTPIYYEDYSWDLPGYLKSNKYFPKPAKGEPRWHFVKVYRAGSCFTGDPSILLQYLEIRDESQLRWIAWSNEHPKLAAVLWPTVVETTRDRQYLFIPDLLELAEAATDADQLQLEVSHSLGDNYCDLAEIQRQLGEHDKAVEHYSRSLSHDPQNVQALQGRATSYKTQGKPDKAKADLATAREITGDKKQ